jgi:hypothetical protein
VPATPNFPGPVTLPPLITPVQFSVPASPLEPMTPESEESVSPGLIPSAMVNEQVAPLVCTRGAPWAVAGTKRNPSTASAQKKREIIGTSFRSEAAQKLPDGHRQKASAENIS